MDDKEMTAEDIEQYLAELGATLKKRGIRKSIHIMIIGGAYMLAYEHMNRTTRDIDIFWLEAGRADSAIVQQSISREITVLAAGEVTYAIT